MSTPNFHQQAAQTAQRMHQQAAQSAQQASRMAADAAARRNAMAGGGAGMRWSGGAGARGPFRLIGFLFKLVLLAVIVVVAITLVRGTFDLDLHGVPGRPKASTEKTAPEGPKRAATDWTTDADRRNTREHDSGS